MLFQRSRRAIEPVGDPCRSPGFPFLRIGRAFSIVGRAFEKFGRAFETAGRAAKSDGGRFSESPVALFFGNGGSCKRRFRVPEWITASFSDALRFSTCAAAPKRVATLIRERGPDVLESAAGVSERKAGDLMHAAVDPTMPRLRRQPGARRRKTPRP